eukprot:1705165-Prymnesium_polylepis.1
MAEPAQALGDRQKHPPPIDLLWHVSLLAVQYSAAPPILRMMEEDAKQIPWAHIPHLDANERGSKSGCCRWMLEAVNYIATRKGDAGIMHWPSHCEAYYATWII